MELVDMLGLEPSAFGVQVRVLFPVKNSWGNTLYFEKGKNLLKLKNNFIYIKS